MTLRAIYNLLDPENEPLVALTGVLKLLRSIEQGESATEEGVFSSVMKFQENYGPVTFESVQEFVMGMGSAILDMDLPDEMVWEFTGD